MQSLSLRCISLLSGLILVLSFSALTLNYFVYQFPGNNYFPENVFTPLIILVLINLGLILSFGSNSKSSRIGREMLYFFGVMSLIALATNAVQLTPFFPIDKYILTFENGLNIDLVSILKWTTQHPHFKVLLISVYDSLPYQMSFIPLFIIALGRIQLIREYYFLLLSTVLIGFLIYYFFPTTAPASNMNSPLFAANQIATGLKFNQIHSHIIPTTNEGGLIALPSFHVIWAILCVYLLKQWKIPCILLGLINSLLILSCVLLGWHYPVDVLAGVVIFGICYYLMGLCKFLNNTR